MRSDTLMSRRGEYQSPSISVFALQVLHQLATIAQRRRVQLKLLCDIRFQRSFALKSPQRKHQDAGGTMANQRQDVFEQGVAVDQSAVEIDYEGHFLLGWTYPRRDGQAHLFLRMLGPKTIHLKDSPAGGRQPKLSLALVFVATPCVINSARFRILALQTAHGI